MGNNHRSVVAYFLVLIVDVLLIGRAEWNGMAWNVMSR